MLFGKRQTAMHLQEFITETISQIIDGVSGAKSRSDAARIRIAPNLKHYMDRLRDDFVGDDLKLPHDVTVNVDGQIIVMIDFDVVLTKTEDTETKGGIGVFLGTVGLGSQGKSGNSNSTETKIHFRVPVALP